ncbi:MAG TPA: class I SAM-dependent methyltransferase [Beijerinckiaceae bacterium]|nr:class I SAM-dependent methyltransferase [Beijerinckiaceae bacterium]
MTRDDALTNADVASAYARWAPIYDLTFALVMRAGRRAAASAASRSGGCVLDVGVGTGLELPMFDRAVRLTGVDLSEPMLRRCQRRVRTGKLDHVHGLCVMDAMQLAFADAAFDVAVAPYVLTVVSDPARTLDELVRVVRPGGEIVLVNHIGATSGPIAMAESWLATRSASLGWRPSFPWSIVQDWLTSRDDVALTERRALPPWGLFTLIRLARL